MKIVSSIPVTPMKSTILFFQAEDGILDHCVTGVQTCALPIWHSYVLVVTGKGGPDYAEAFAERGVLRRSVPHWLREIGRASCRESVEIGERRRHETHLDLALVAAEGVVDEDRLQHSGHADEEHHFVFSSRRRHTRSLCDWSSDVCSSDLAFLRAGRHRQGRTGLRGGLRRARGAPPQRAALAA